MWFTRLSIANPVMATMAMLAFVVLGLFAYNRLKVDQFPNIEFPVVVVQVDYPGASPEIVESEVTRRVEEAVNTIAGIKQLTSRSYEGSAVVIIEFNLEVDGRRAADDVREKVAAVRPLLRDEVKEPRILRFDPAARPIFTLALLSPDGSRGQMELTTYADQVVKKRLENAGGVGSVTLAGGLKRQVQVRVRPQDLEAQGVSVAQVMAAVQAENQERPAGALRTESSERLARIDARLRRPEQFGELIVARRGNAVVRLSQVADVVDGPQEVESLALYNGQRTIALDVLKAQGENTVDVVRNLQRAIDKLKPELPPGMALEVVRDSSRPILVAVQNVRQTLIEGAVLTVLIVFLFLNSWRSTVITGLTLPIALIGTFFFMQVFGFSINMVTLMALSLCVGLLIDDAIVVRENIVRHLQMGKGPLRAALDGTNEIGLAVLATTLSIVAVFLPIGFMGGIIGKFFHEFGITIVAAVLISMFVSFTLDPMMSSVWHDPAVAPGAHGGRSLYDRTLGRLTGAVDRWSHGLGRGYERLLGWSLRHRLATVLIALASLIASFVLIPRLGTEFVPKADYSETFVNFYTPMGSSIEVTEARTRQVEALLRRMPEVRYTVATINTGQALGRNFVSIYVRLTDRHTRSRSVDELSVPLREQLARLPGITVTHVGLLDPVGGLKPISVSVQGGDLRELQRISQRLIERFKAIPGLVDLDTSQKPARPTVSIRVRRDAASDLGLGVGAIADALRPLVAGEVAGVWRAEDDQTYDIVVQLTPQARRSAEDLARLSLAVGTRPDGTPRIVRLGEVADVVDDLGPSQINRRALNREVEITANFSGRSLGEVSADIRSVLADTPLPSGYGIRFGGSTQDMQDAFGYALQALAMAVIFIYMILASQFRSFTQPLALMTSLPLTLIGVVLTLLLFRSSLNMFSIIGVIMLMGLVTKNAILLVDFANRARQGLGEQADDPAHREPMGREAALLLAARVRLRPILMTTLAMVFGMVPLAFALSEGAEQRAPLGQAVVGGVIASSLLTLVVVPVVYCWLDDLSGWLKRRAGHGAHLAPAAPLDAP
ncbi:MAG: efflux RND transporter permease subunit [Burkholderiales bacterium]|nr:efflux RND transporter permease subunit [Burkholderiales bacterium]